MILAFTVILCGANFAPLDGDDQNSWQEPTKGVRRAAVQAKMDFSENRAWSCNDCRRTQIPDENSTSRDEAPHSKTSELSRSYYRLFAHERYARGDTSEELALWTC